MGACRTGPDCLEEKDSKKHTGTRSTRASSLQTALLARLFRRQTAFRRRAGWYSAERVVSAQRPTADRVDNAIWILASRVETLEKFAKKFSAKQLNSWLRSTRFKDRSGRKTLWSGSQVKDWTDLTIRQWKKQREWLDLRSNQRGRKWILPQWSRQLLSFGINLLREINPPGLSSSLTQDRWTNKL